MVEIVGNRARILQLLQHGLTALRTPRWGRHPSARGLTSGGSALAQRGLDAVEVSGGGALLAADAHRVLEELVVGLSDRDA